MTKKRKEEENHLLLAFQVVEALTARHVFWKYVEQVAPGNTPQGTFDAALVDAESKLIGFDHEPRGVQVVVELHVRHGWLQRLVRVIRLLQAWCGKLHSDNLRIRAACYVR